MTGASQNKPCLSFGHFLEYLRLNKFEITLAHYFRLQQVFEELGEELRTDESANLKSILSSILASSETKQHEFSKLFDEYIKYCESTVGRSKPPATLQETGQSATATGYPKRYEEPLALSTQHRRAPNKRRKFGLSIIAALAILALAIIPLVLKSRQHPREVNVLPKPLPVSSVTPTPSPTIDQTPARPEKPAPPLSFYLAMASVFFVCCGLILLVRRIFHSLAIRSYRKKTAPFKWPLRAVAPPVRIYDSEKFRRVARLLRRRQVDEFFRLDINATLSATIRSLGYPSFRYAPATRIPEYLVMIERVSPGDHQARLFDEMIRALKHEGVAITRYFYRDDPLVGWDERGETSVRLERLKQRHAGHRLLFFGTGKQMLDPVTGRLAEHMSVLSDWHERAVLTPESNWGWQEEVLAENFILVSANPDGLLTLVSHLESGAERSSVNWPAPDPHPLPTQIDDLRLDLVRTYLGDQVFQWLCACAVYSELRWDLTLLLGSLPSMPPGMVNEANLLRLSRILWFRNGLIPDAVRHELIKALDPAKSKVTRKAVVALMEDTVPPPEETFASSNYNLELALHRWLLQDSRSNLSELRRTLKEMPARQLARNTITGNLLKMVPHPIFGRRLPGLLYRRGLPTLGLSTLTLALVAIALLVTALTAIRVRAKDVPEWAYSPFLAKATPTPYVTPPPTPPPSITPPPPSPTVTVTVTPTVTPTPRPTPTPTPSPTPTSPTPTPTPSTWEEQKVTFSFPAGWKQTESSPAMAVWGAKSGKATAFTIVSISTMSADFPVDTSLNAFYSSAMTNLKNGKFDEVNWMEIDGIKGVQSLESNPERPDDIRRLQWVGYRNYNGAPQLVNILLSSTGKDFSAFQTQLYQILRSTKLGQ